MSEKWVRDTGVVFALLFLLLGYKWGPSYLAASAAFLLALLFVPAVLRPLAWCWLKLTEGLGFVMNRVFFGLVFFAVIVPVGLLRRLLKGDARDLVKQKVLSTAFIHRDHTVTADDLAQPY